MYQYDYVHCEVKGLFADPGAHREIIDKKAGEGWRFVCFIPNDFTSHGAIRGGDLVFEREAE